MKTKLAILLNSFPSISEKFILNHVAGEIIAGTDVTVFAAHRSNERIKHDLYDALDMDKVTVFTDIPRPMVKRLFAVPLLFFKLLLKNPRAALETLHFHKYQTVAKNCKLLYFGLCFSGRHYDVVHCHFGMNGLIGCYLKTCGFCDRIITTFHGADINLYPKHYGQKVYCAVYRESDWITANTEFTKSKIIANAALAAPETAVADKIKVIPVGLFVKDYETAAPVEKIPNSVLTIGRLEEKKGYRYALEAVALTRKSVPSIQYYIIGEGTLRRALEDYARELGIADCCHFLGALQSSEVIHYYHRCAVFMLASVTAQNGDMEGQGLVLQEAQAAGLPVVSTLHNGIPEGIISGVMLNTGGGGVQSRHSFPKRTARRSPRKSRCFYATTVSARRSGKRAGTLFVASTTWRRLSRSCTGFTTGSKTRGGRVCVTPLRKSRNISPIPILRQVFFLRNFLREARCRTRVISKSSFACGRAIDSI
ncbi:MAG: colanic acid biosynthesis glycosyltransferase WcaL [Treponematales bacterium]